MKGLISTALVCGLALGASVAVAQKPAHAPMAHHRATGQANSAGAPKPAHTFGGIAKKLNTTPEALESAYATARAANPKLTRGQFVSANMVANNLSAKDPTITTQVILDGLKSGKSMGQTLRGLGLSAKEATAAERQARRDARAAEEAAEKTSN